MKQFLAKYWYLPAILAGVLSGYLVFWGIYFTFFITAGIPFQGVIFGIIALVYFDIFPKIKPSKKRASWLPICFVSFWVAWQIIIYSHFTPMGPTEENTTGLIVTQYQNYFSFSPAVIYGLAGFVGVSIITVAFHFLFLRLNWRSIITLLLAGTLIPAFWAWTGTAETLSAASALSLKHPWLEYWPLFLFISWQTVVMLVFGYRINSPQI